MVVDNGNDRYKYYYRSLLRSEEDSTPMVTEIVFSVSFLKVVHPNYSLEIGDNMSFFCIGTKGES